MRIKLALYSHQLVHYQEFTCEVVASMIEESSRSPSRSERKITHTLVEPERKQNEVRPRKQFSGNCRVRSSNILPTRKQRSYLHLYPFLQQNQLDCSHFLRPLLEIQLIPYNVRYQQGRWFVARLTDTLSVERCMCANMKGGWGLGAVLAT